MTALLYAKLNKLIPQIQATYAWMDECHANEALQDEVKAEAALDALEGEYYQILKRIVSTGETPDNIYYAMCHKASLDISGDVPKYILL
jgi:hypothetical protein